MKTKMQKMGPYLLLGLVFLMLLVLNIFFQDHWLDSDMAAEMMFSKLLAEEGHIFATPNWYYSTEFRFLYTQLIMGPLFRIMDNWHVIRTITNVVFYVLMIVSYFYCVKPLKLSKTLTVLSSTILLLPFSETMMTHMQMGNTYLSHVIILFFFFGMFLRLAEKVEYKKWQKLVLLICYMVLALICGVSGVRYLLAMQCPLVIAAFIYFLKAEAFQQFRKETTVKEVLTLRNWKTVLSAREASYLFYSVAGAAGSVLGYGINVLVVSKNYVFQTYDATNFISIYQGELWDRMQNAIGCLLMLFGYIPDKGFLSLRGLISMIAFAMLIGLIYFTVKSYKTEKGNRFFLALFVIVAFLLNVFVFSFTTSTMVPRYYLTIFIFVLPLIGCYFEAKNPAIDKVFTVLLLVVCLGMSTAKTVLSFMTADKNESKRPVAEFLVENDYHFGFATYTNGNIITEITNGEVEIANIGDPEYLEYFKWSTPFQYYEENYHAGETFLLLTVEEYAEFAEADAVVNGKNIYEDDAYVVLVYDDVETLMSHAQVR